MPRGMNHFVPVWTHAEVGEHVVAEIDRYMEERIQQCVQQRSDLAQKIAQQTWDTSATELDPMAVVFLTSQMTEISQHLAKLMNFQVLQEWLKEHDLVSLPARGDGNCGLHTLLPLSLGDPLSEFEMLENERKTLISSMRSAIADFWTQASSKSEWLHVYHTIIDIFDTEPGLANEEPPLPPPKKEPILTPQKRQSCIPEVIDLCQDSEPPVLNQEPPLPPPKEEPPQTPQKRKSCISESIDLCTPPRVQSVGATRSAMSQDSKPLSSDVQQQLVSQLESGPPEAEKPKGRNRGGRKRQKQPSKPEPEPAEGPSGPQEEQTAEKHVRIRAVQKRLVTLQDRKLEILKTYLASLNLNWSASQRFHSTNQIGKHSQACKSNRGFCVMQARLIELKMPECLTCVALLHSVEFDMEKLEKLMKDCEKPDGEFPSPFTRMKRKADSLQSDGQSHCEPAAIVDDVRMNPDMNPAQNCTNAEPEQGVDHGFCTICLQCLVISHI